VEWIASIVRHLDQDSRSNFSQYLERYIPATWFLIGDLAFQEYGMMALSLSRLSRDGLEAINHEMDYYARLPSPDGNNLLQSEYIAHLDAIGIKVLPLLTFLAEPTRQTLLGKNNGEQLLLFLATLSEALGVVKTLQVLGLSGVTITGVRDAVALYEQERLVVMDLSFAVDRYLPATKNDAFFGQFYGFIDYESLLTGKAKEHLHQYYLQLNDSQKRAFLPVCIQVLAQQPVIETVFTPHDARRSLTQASADFALEKDHAAYYERLERVYLPYFWPYVRTVYEIVETLIAST
jgi:hypothetical protein